MSTSGAWMSSLVRLTDGHCRYRIDGPVDGTPLLLIHGATVPAWEFDRLVPYLTDAGFRCLRADLFGHGGSERPQLTYDHDLFVRQLLELLDRLGFDPPLGVLGHSLGAVVGIRLIVENPERFTRIALAAPMLDFVAGNPLLRLMQVPVLGELLIPTVVLPMLMRRRRKRYTPVEDGRFVGLFREQLAYRGFGRALLSLIRSGSLADQADAYLSFAELGHPAAIFRGAEDVIVGSEDVHRITTLLPRAHVTTIDGTGHSFIITDPDKLAPELVRFFGSQPASVTDVPRC